MFEDRPIMSAKHRLTVTFDQNWPMHTCSSRTVSLLLVNMATVQHLIFDRWWILTITWPRESNFLPAYRIWCIYLCPRPNMCSGNEIPSGDHWRFIQFTYTFWSQMQLRRHTVHHIYFRNILRDSRVIGCCPAWQRRH